MPNAYRHAGGNGDDFLAARTAKTATKPDAGNGVVNGKIGGQFDLPAALMYQLHFLVVFVEIIDVCKNEKQIDRNKGKDNIHINLHESECK